MQKLALTTAMAFVLALPASAAPGDPAPAAPKPARERSGVMRYDTNKDGFVDRAEWTAGQEARFKQLDSDKDGKLSRDELFARTPASDGSALPSDKQFQRQTTYFQRVDTDKDGFVSKSEFMTQADRNFARCDLDKDGRINTAECRQALRRQPTTPTRTDR